MQKMKFLISKSAIIIYLAIAIFIFFLIVPYIANEYLFSWRSSKTNGNGELWIGFFATYYGAIVGGIIAGALTLIGVKMTISDNYKMRQKDKVPEKIFRLEKIMSILDETNEKIGIFQRVELKPDFSIAEKTQYLYIDDAMNIEQTELYENITKEFLDNLNKEIVFVDAELYRQFYEMRIKYNYYYNEFVDPISSQLSSLTEDIVQCNFDKGVDVVSSKWSSLDKSEYQKEKYKEILSKLYSAERDIMYKQQSLILDLKIKIQIVLSEYIKRMDY